MGVIPIENEKRVNWSKIRAEYIGGGTTYRALAEKYGVSLNIVAKRATAEGWSKDRKEVSKKAAKKVIQKAAEAVADNATLAANIKRQGLEILAALFADFASIRATEHRESNQGVTDIKRLRDLTAAYKDLCGDVVQSETDSALLQSLLALERGRND